MKNLLPEWVDRLSGSRYRATIWFERYFSWGMRASSELEPVSEDRFRDALGSVPVRVPSSELAMKLRVLASRESQRRRLEPSWTLRLYKWRDELRLQINNVARPFAIPTAGGFLSAFLLFGLLGPTLEVPGSVAKANDIPTGLYTEASVKTLMPVGFEEREL
ncbi:MAG TPA: hypothetical protein VEQ63_09310, partial [Bryobacteraceae bacterium]|nr:hypothetical protein [Bryobacteraceae bacterium]